MSGKKRRNISAVEKVSILRLHFIENIPVSDLCDKYHIHPTMFYRWQKTFFEKGELAFESENRGVVKGLERKIEKLETKMSNKDEVIVELLGEHIALKKSLGEI